MFGAKRQTRPLISTKNQKFFQNFSQKILIKSRNFPKKILKARYSVWE